MQTIAGDLFLPCRHGVRSEKQDTPFKAARDEMRSDGIRVPARSLVRSFARPLAEVIRLKVPTEGAYPFLARLACRPSRETGTRRFGVVLNDYSSGAGVSIAFVSARSIGRDPAHFPRLRDPLAEESTATEHYISQAVIWDLRGGLECRENHERTRNRDSELTVEHRFVGT